METVNLEWDGKPYALAVDMRALRQIERVVFRPEVQADLRDHGVMTPVDIAEIFCNLLNLAGVKPALTIEQTRNGLFGSGGSLAAATQAQAVIQAIMGTSGNPNAPENPTRPARRARRAASSRKRTR